MAETTRTWAQVLALLADNETGEIGAQDLKDALHSIYQCWASLVRSGLGAAGISFAFSDTEQQVVNYDRALDYGGIDASLSSDDHTILAGGDGVYKVDYGLVIEPAGDTYNLYLKKDTSRLYSHNAEGFSDDHGQSHMLLTGKGHITGCAENDVYSLWLGRSGTGNDTLKVYAAWFLMERVG